MTPCGPPPDVLYWIQTGKEGGGMADQCEFCSHYEYDDEWEMYVCDMPLDIDEMERFLTHSREGCPYYRNGDDYAIVRKQN